MFLIFNFCNKTSILRLVCSKTPFKSISILSFCMRNHYELLGVPRNATQADIKAAYYKLSMVYHPDRNETVEAAESFREITEAYEVIGNFKLRKMYDKGLLGHLATEDGRRTSYTNYNTSTGNLKNKPTHHGRMSVYNFDEWSQFHYGEVFSRRNDAKVRYEEKTNATSTVKGQGKNENIIFVIFVLTCLAFIGTYSIADSYDGPKPPSKPK